MATNVSTGSADIWSRIRRDFESQRKSREVEVEEEDEDFPGEDDAVMEEEEGEKETPVKPAGKESKSKKKKKKKKAKKNRQEQQKQAQQNKEPEKNPEEDVQIEYVQEQLELDPSDPNYHNSNNKKTSKSPPPHSRTHKNKDEDDANKISKKKLKKLTRLSVAQLKQLVTRPDVVEMHDVTAKDPRLLVHLKATRNTVPVPRHWSYKRKYLQGKRGIEKAPFELPDFIRATGIEDMRAALQEKEEAKNLKAKMREKVRPKLGKIDIDYQKLHDAFFRFQTKPKMTIHGDLYYESKEFETRLKEKKPGNLTDDLRVALGMPVGANAERIPPPWLIAMQRYGPPPSYPNLKIPGLNAAIPEGCSFGYHAGGWGKPPVDENGKPLYTRGADLQEAAEEEELDKSHWGELESESESEEESEEEDDEEPDDTGLVTPAEGLVTPSGLTSIPVGVETPDMIELRKRRIEDDMDQGGDTPALYTVLPEKKTAVGQAMMGSAHIYDLTGKRKKQQADSGKTSKRYKDFKF
ncbi:splicing factor 3B subunit 2-like isoform X2 [Littorina saxatilis]|uniref:splicing factor 3B subunit 2-like isoform X2 n=1 Tax=Littorina saxatilis TaxID=31220 RepID=UPI0038B64EFD